MQVVFAFKRNKLFHAFPFVNLPRFNSSEPCTEAKLTVSTLVEPTGTVTTYMVALAPWALWQKN